MATVLSCGVCKYPMTFKDIAPGYIGEVEHLITCNSCGTKYTVTVLMNKRTHLTISQVEAIKNKPSE